MKERVLKQFGQQVPTGSLLTVKIVRTASKAISPELIEANRNTRKRLAELRSSTQVEVYRVPDPDQH